MNEESKLQLERYLQLINRRKFVLAIPIVLAVVGAAILFLLIYLVFRRAAEAAIIMLTVHNTEAAKVEALDAGADDFVTKPFSTPELLARIRAALRRAPAAQSSPGRFRAGELTIDFGARTVSRGGVTSHLTPKELDLLRYLTQHANQAVPHRELLQAVWGPDYGDQNEYLRVFMNLRRKIEANPEHPEFIVTEPWVGYRFQGVIESL